MIWRFFRKTSEVFRAPFRPAAAFLLLFLASCTRPAAVDTPTLQIPTSLPTATALATAQPPHAAEINFALVGSVNNANVWALFDSTGYSYNDYAVRSEYWPRLYHLTIPDGKFEPQAAAGSPSPVHAEGALFTSTVPLRLDLKWTDGSPFTADDVAFTVNTALSFRLGFDWRAYYDPAWIDHAEAIDAHTVKFYFKRAPNVAVWQYGALQGPVVQKGYWAPKLTDAAALLPTAGDLAKIDSLNTQAANLQKSIRDLIAAGATATGSQARDLQSQLKNQQSNLDGVRNDLAKAEGAVDASMNAARQSLYAVEAAGEPTLGTWTLAGQYSGTWTNIANPAHPFASPNFDRAVYTLYPDEASAAAALKNGDVNSLLEPDGLSPKLTAQGIPGTRMVSNRDSSAHFLLLNPARPWLADPVLRRAISCAVDALIRKPLPLSSFVPGGQPWVNPAAVHPCGDGPSSPDPLGAVAVLKAGGYAWVAEPSALQGGTGLTRPDGELVPPFALLAPSAAQSPEAQDAAQVAAAALQYLGLTVTVQAVDPAQIRYAVFNDHKYDMAVVGWQLSAYPGYLCDWFGDGNPLGYNIPQVRADCAALSTTGDLEAARQLVFDIQSVLAQDTPFIPLFSGLTYDAIRGLVYPFGEILNGLSGVYGAPSVAIPSSP